jgi:hypothetical protein
MHRLLTDTLLLTVRPGAKRLWRLPQMPQITHLHSNVLMSAASAVFNGKAACMHADASVDGFCSALTHITAGAARFMKMIGIASLGHICTLLFMFGMCTQCFTFLGWDCFREDCSAGYERACTCCRSALNVGWYAFDVLVSAYPISIAVPGVAEGAFRLW